MTLVIDLSKITDDEKQAVHCRTIEEAQIFLDAVRVQRTDIGTTHWERTLTSKKYEGKAFMLSYTGCKQLRYGEAFDLKRQGIEIIPFEALLRSFDLPEIDANQTGILSLLGL